MHYTVTHARETTGFITGRPECFTLNESDVLRRHGSVKICNTIVA